MMRPITGQTRIGRSRILDGWGVFATEDIRKDLIVERVPCLLLPRDDLTSYGWRKGCAFTHGYTTWREDAKLIAAGSSSYFNHRCPANVSYFLDHPQESGTGSWILTIVAERDLRRGEELFINYGGAPDNPTKQPFEEE